MSDEIKRLFFGMQVIAPWPTDLPKGRVLEETQRHMTLVFLGNISYSTINDLLTTFPLPNFKIGQGGYFDKLLFLPESNPRVAAWHMKWLNPKINFADYCKKITTWLALNQINIETRDYFLPHVTISRMPFDSAEWSRSFLQLPWIIGNLHLYESLGNLHYRSLWQHTIQSPFEELDHTADIAYRIYGETLQDIYYNAFLALAFEFTDLVHYFTELESIESLDAIVIHLNRLIAKADMKVGCPFKAVSFHGDIQKEKEYLTWEMIIDV